MTQAIFPPQFLPGNRTGFDTSAGRPGVSGALSLALYGARTTSITANIPVEIFDLAQARTLFGAKSELAYQVMWALRGQRDYGGRFRLWAVPMADPAGVASATEYTVTGSSTAAGAIKIRIGGVPISTAILASGTSATDAASAIATAVTNEQEIPFNGTSSLGVATATAVQTGVNGEDFRHEVIEVPAGLAVAAASSATGTGALDLAAAFTATETLAVRHIAISGSAAGDATAVANHLVAVWPPNAQKMPFVVMASRQTLATALPLATAIDNFPAVVFAGPGCRTPAAGMAAYIAGTIAGEPIPNRPWKTTVPLRSLALADEADLASDAQVESFGPQGLSIIGHTDRGDQYQFIRTVTTSTTVDGSPSDSEAEYAAMLTLRDLAIFIKEDQDVAFSQSTFATATKKQVRGRILDRLRDYERAQYLRNVSELASALVVQDTADNPLVPPDRYLAIIPAGTVLPLYGIDNKIQLVRDFSFVL